MGEYFLLQIRGNFYIKTMNSLGGGRLKIWIFIKSISFE